MRKKLFKLNNKGAVLMIVLFMLVLLVGLAYSFTIVAVSTYQAAKKEIDQTSAEFEAKSTAQALAQSIATATASSSIGDIMLYGSSIEEALSYDNGRSVATYTNSVTNNVGNITIDTDSTDSSILYVTVTTTVGEVSNSATVVMYGTPRDKNELASDYNIHITSPTTSNVQDFQSMAVNTGIAKMYITSTPDNGGNNYIMTGAFPDDGVNSQVTVSGDLNMTGGIFRANITAYGDLSLNAVTVEGYNGIDVQGRINIFNGSVIHKGINSFNDVTVTGTGKNVDVVGQNGGKITSYGNVTVNNGKIGNSGGVSIAALKSVTLTDATSTGNIISKGSDGVELTNSICVGNIYSEGDVILINSRVAGSIYAKGDVIIQNRDVTYTEAVKYDVYTDGDATFTNTVIGRDVYVNGDLDLAGEISTNIYGNCTVDGSLTTSRIGTSYSSSGYHQFGTTTANFLSIGGSNGPWYSGGPEAIILMNVDVKGVLKTNPDYFITFWLNPYDSDYQDNLGGSANYLGRKSIIYEMHTTKAFVVPTDCHYGWYRAWYTTITNLYLFDTVGNPLDAKVHMAYFDNVYGGNLTFSAVHQSSTTAIWQGEYIDVGASSPSRVMGKVYASNGLRLNRYDSGHSYDTTTFYVKGGLTVDSADVELTKGTIYASGTIDIGNGTVTLPTLEVANSSTFTDVYQGVTFTGNLKTRYTGLLNIAGSVGGDVYTPGSLSIGSLSSIGGSVTSSGSIIIYGTIAGNLYSGSSVTLKSSGSVGTAALTSNTEVRCVGFVNEAGATCNSRIYNTSSGQLTMNVSCWGIYTLGNINVSSGCTVKGNIVATSATATSTIYAAVEGNIDVGLISSLDMYQSGVSGHNVSGNVRAKSFALYGATVYGNVYCDGNIGGYTIRLEGAHIRGYAYAPTDGAGMRLGGGCTVGGAVTTGDLTGRTAIHIGGQLNFSAWNVAYGDVRCKTYLSGTGANVEGCGGRIYGQLYASESISVNASAGGSAAASYYTSMYTPGDFVFIGNPSAVDYIGEIMSPNVTITDASLVTALNNVTTSGVISYTSGATNCVLTDTSTYGIYMNATDVTLNGNSPCYGSVNFKADLIQSSGSPISGNIETLAGTGQTISLNASIGGTIYVYSSTKLVVASGLTIGGDIYATSLVTLGNGVTVNGKVVCYNGDITTGTGCVLNSTVGNNDSYAGRIVIGASSFVAGSMSTREDIIIGNSCTINGATVTSTTASVTVGSGSNVAGSVYASVTLTNNGTINGSTYSGGNTIINGNIGDHYSADSVYCGGSITMTENKVINGNLYVGTTGTTTIKGSVYGNIYVSGPVQITATSGGTGSRYIGTNSANTLYSLSSIYVASQYYIRSSVKNLYTSHGNIDIDYAVGGNIDCAGTLDVGSAGLTGFVSGTVWSDDTTNIYGNIGGSIYCYTTGNKDVRVTGNIAGNASIKGTFIQSGVVSGSMELEGGWTPIGVSNFLSGVSLTGNLTINVGSTAGARLGSSVSDIIDIDGTLTINVNAGNAYYVYGTVKCDYLRVNTSVDTSTVYTTAPNWTAGGRVYFYNDVHVYERAYLNTCNFQPYVNGSLLGSSVFVGRHMTARYTNFYAHGYTSEDVIASNANYGSFSVGYRQTTAEDANAGDAGGVIMQDSWAYSRIAVKGHLRMWSSYLAKTNTTNSTYKNGKYIGGSLVMYQSGIYSYQKREGSDCEAKDTVTLINSNCYMQDSFIGYYDSGEDGSGKDQTFEGLYINGSMGWMNNSYIRVDTRVNGGLTASGSRYRVAEKWKIWFSKRYWAGWLYINGSKRTGSYSGMAIDRDGNAGDDGTGINNGDITAIANASWTGMYTRCAYEGTSVGPLAPTTNHISANSGTVSENGVGAIGATTTSTSGTNPANQSANSIPAYNVGSVIGASGAPAVNGTVGAGVASVASSNSTYYHVNNVDAAASPTYGVVAISTFTSSEPAPARKPINPLSLDSSLNTVLSVHTDSGAGFFWLDNWLTVDIYASENNRGSTYGGTLPNLFNYINHDYVDGSIAHPWGWTCNGGLIAEDDVDLALKFHTQGVDMHIILPQKYAIWAKDDEGSRIMVDGGGKVFIYLMGENFLHFEDGWQIGGDKNYSDNPPSSFRTSYPELYFIAVGGYNYIRFDEIMMRASFYLPRGRESTVGAGINYLRINDEGGGASYLNGIVVVDYMSFYGDDGAFQLTTHDWPTSIYFKGAYHDFDYFLTEADDGLGVSNYTYTVGELIS